MARPPCPVCKNNDHVEPNGLDGYVCCKCKGLFDNEPDEGGDYFTDPAKRLERSENRKPPRRQRRSFHR